LEIIITQGSCRIVKCLATHETSSDHHVIRRRHLGDNDGHVTVEDIEKQKRSQNKNVQQESHVVGDNTVEEQTKHGNNVEVNNERNYNDTHNIGPRRQSRSAFIRKISAGK
jgi:hypothetical protein